MADKKISDLVEDTSPAAGDYLVMVDLDDLAMGPTGSNKKVKAANLLALVPPAPAPVTSVAGRTGDVRLSTADVAGLGSAAAHATTDFDAFGAAAAVLASPAFTGMATAPTAAVGTNTTQLATTAFVLANGPKGPGSAGAVGDIQIGDGSGGFLTATKSPIHYDPNLGIASFAGGNFQIDASGGIHLGEIRASYLELSNYPSQPATRITRRIGQTSPLIIIRDEATNATVAGHDANGAQILLQQADSVALNGSQYYSTTQLKVVFKDSNGVFR